MSFTMDTAFGIHAHVWGGDDFGGEWHDLGSREDHAVKFQLQPSFADEVPGAFGVFEVATKLSSTGKH
jgi:hypothetical protein